MPLRDFYIPLIVVVICSTGIALFMSDAGTQYGITGYQNSSLMSVANRINQSATTMAAQLQSAQIGIPVLDIPFAILNGAYTVLKTIIYDIPTLWIGLITALMGQPPTPANPTGSPGLWQLGLSPYMNLAILIIGVIVAFEILSILVKWRT